MRAGAKPGSNPVAGGLPGVEIELDVIARAASASALAVNGVLALENAFSDGLAAVVGGLGYARGVRVTPEQDGCCFNIGAVIQYGENIPEIAWRLQENVKKTVEELIGVRVKKVDVLITGVRESPKAALRTVKNGSKRVRGGDAADTPGGNAADAQGENAVRVSDGDAICVSDDNAIRVSDGGANRAFEESAGRDA